MKDWGHFLNLERPLLQYWRLNVKTLDWKSLWHSSLEVVAKQTTKSEQTNLIIVWDGNRTNLCSRIRAKVFHLWLFVPCLLPLIGNGNLVWRETDTILKSPHKIFPLESPCPAIGLHILPHLKAQMMKSRVVPRFSDCSVFWVENTCFYYWPVGRAGAEMFAWIIDEAGRASNGEPFSKNFKTKEKTKTITQNP